MTELEKKQIKILREQGLGYKAISNRTGISVGSLRHFLKTDDVEVNKSPEGFCLNCNKIIKQNRKFCSRACGLMWWDRHPEFLVKRALYTFTCPACNRAFTVYGNRKRKYCSHSCYIKARFGEKSYEA